MSHAPQQIASLFAVALDAEDYAAARDLLADNCVYKLGDVIHRGPDAVIDCYVANGDTARGRFDEVHNFSTVETTGPFTAAVTFTDYLRRGDRWHDFRCRQHIRIDPAGLVEAITHEELPHERARLRAFESSRAKSE
jgi:hypothetical protein